ncbi:hypothetical protein O163_01185 [Caldanaerobacter subterraneus subsp. yonseiensis KB-1]|uniref:Uncharacterized protein n=2 Tax=Caldanaerobacter subterraneus TaxID=911092 RepID=Q8RCF3_CALS4|nr:hypothetical protein TTE0479 [Caldanaerobacter subterraneus subsp. tengcongensis MB4]ERM93305.1 hypothetical protein O163_01185 [Caldanaerobacter subterraneus subsp. yonseiensis KB-1]
MEGTVIKLIYLVILFIGALYCLFSFLPLFVELDSIFHQKSLKKFMKMNEKN